MRAQLLTWFEANARPLPWRTPGTRDPYRVLVAETLLQQTQAARAGEAFERFVARFPDLATLAAARDHEVLAQWQGLGYYQRALRLHRCAQVLVRDYGGALPNDLVALEALPGVGRYTARAIAAQAFGEPRVAVDANVRRLGARVLGLRQPLDSAIEAGLAALLTDAGFSAASNGPRPDSVAGPLAEALIELGATRCTPRRPACDGCPLRHTCHAAASGEPEAFPAPRPRRPPRREELQLLVARRGTSVALARRPAGGRWAGLWGFPQAGDARPVGRALDGFDHGLSHRSLQVRPLLVRADQAPPGVVWVPLPRVAEGGGEHPVAAVDQRLARQLLAADGSRRDRPSAQAGAA